jgi:hypothetical protein
MYKQSCMHVSWMELMICNGVYTASRFVWFKINSETLRGTYITTEADTHSSINKASITETNLGREETQTEVQQASSLCDSLRSPPWSSEVMQSSITLNFLSALRQLACPPAVRQKRTLATTCSSFCLVVFLVRTSGMLVLLQFFNPGIKTWRCFFK